MKILKFIIVFAVTITLGILLNIKIGDTPPLAKFLNPFQGFWQNSEETKLNLSDKLVLKGLQAEANVIYDDRLVPHIFANNDHDLYYLQGYITARHRLWQMELQTHAAAGRVSEIIGDKGFEFDRKQRRKGMVYAANINLEEVMKDSSTKASVLAYVEGVNTYIASLNHKNLPVEYKLLNYYPEAWTPLKTCLLLKSMADDLSGWDADLEYTNALKLIGKENFDLLFPDEASLGSEPVIPADTKWDFEPEKLDTVPDYTFPLVFTLKQSAEKPDRDNGSNNWAVSGNKSKSGKPMLANDVHLNLNLPSIWFEVQLNAPGVNTYGASIPGAPYVIIGFNDSIAWGETNARRDVKDYYKIRFQDKTRNKYYYENEWIGTEKVLEEIKIRGKKTFIDTVIYTIHGPVIFDEHFYNEKRNINLALRWTGHDASNEALTFFKLNRANNHQDYLNSFDTYACPAQNFAFISATGDIAMYIAGKFPIKWPEQGKYLMDGSKQDQTWQKFIPQSHQAQVLNPKREFVSSANQQPVAKSYPYYVFDGHYEHYRNRRINQVLSEKDSMTVEDFMRLQNDNYNLLAVDGLPVLLSLIAQTKLNATEKKYLGVLNTWNYYSDPESEGAAIFNAWFNNYNALVWDELTSDTLALPIPEESTTMRLTKENPEHPFFNIITTPQTENASDVALVSFKNTVAELESWKASNNMGLNWGNYKSTRIMHLLRLPAFSVTDIFIGGGKFIVNATKEKHGPAWKMIVDFADDGKKYGIYPGGQSGNPGSPFYSNFINDWANGKYYELLVLRPGDATQGFTKQSFMPAEKK